MPIRINLLAEAQAAEDLRRRDPVKRVIYGGLLLVAIMLVWSSTLQLKVIMANRDLNSVQNQTDSETNAYNSALLNQAKIAATKSKILQLEKLTNARLLQGNLLNALQKIYVDNVQLTGMKVEQNYSLNKNSGKNGSATEKIVVTLNARDSSANPGDQVGKFKDALAALPYFKEMLDPTNGINLVDESPPETDPDGKSYVLFTLECHFPDETR